MRIIDKSDATDTFAEYISQIGSGPLIVASERHPVAALVPIENADIETVSLSTNHEFLDLIERSRLKIATEGGISSEEMRRRFS